MIRVCVLTYFLGQQKKNKFDFSLSLKHLLSFQTFQTYRQIKSFFKQNSISSSLKLIDIQIEIQVINLHIFFCFLIN